MSDLNIPDGASGVYAGGTQPLWICLIPVKRGQGCAELAVFILHQQKSSVKSAPAVVGSSAVQSMAAVHDGCTLQALLVTAGHSWCCLS